MLGWQPRNVFNLASFVHLYGHARDTCSHSYKKHYSAAVTADVAASKNRTYK